MSIRINPDEVDGWAAAIKGFGPQVQGAAGNLRLVNGLDLPPEAVGLVHAATGKVPGLLGSISQLLNSSSQLAAGMATLARRADAPGLDIRPGRAGARVIEAVADFKGFKDANGKRIARSGDSLFRAVLDTIERGTGSSTVKLYSDYREWRAAGLKAMEDLRKEPGGVRRGARGAVDLIRASLNDRAANNATRPLRAMLARQGMEMTSTTAKDLSRFNVKSLGPHALKTVGPKALAAAPYVSTGVNGVITVVDVRKAIADPSAYNIAKGAGSGLHSFGDLAALTAGGSMLVGQPEVAGPALVVSGVAHGAGYAVETTNAIGAHFGLWDGPKPPEEPGSAADDRPYSTWDPFGPTPSFARPLGR